MRGRCGEGIRLFVPVEVSTMTDTTDVNRRSVLKGTLALGGAASVAGCSALPFGGGGGGGDRLSYGDEVQAELTEGAETDPFRDVPADTHEFTGSAGDRVVITMESDPLDTYLLLSKDDELVAENDDASGLNSRIETELPENGRYTIWASRYGELMGMTSGETEGEYTLTLEEA